MMRGTNPATWLVGIMTTMARPTFWTHSRVYEEAETCAFHNGSDAAVRRGKRGDMRAALFVTVVSLIACSRSELPQDLLRRQDAVGSTAQDETTAILVTTVENARQVLPAGRLGVVGGTRPSPRMFQL
jgi:hypothetical protein